MLAEQLSEKGTITKKWKIEKFNSDADFKLGNVAEILKFEENILLNEGITEMLNLICGISGTAFSNAAANLGVGTGAAFSSLTGTVTFTNGSAAVSAVGGAFTTELVVGQQIILDADDVMVEVQTITNDDNLVLTAVYPGTGGAGAASAMPVAVATETGLQGTNAYAVMEASYPQVAGQTMTFRSVFAAGVATIHWREATVANGGSNASTNMNRKIQEMGVKAAGAVWTLELQITLS